MRAEHLRLLHRVAVVALGDDDERLDAAELVLDVRVRDVVRRVLPDQRRAPTVGSPMVRPRTK